ncbi:hypothetical protein IKQ19_10055 [Candidatus Saccharibacteria bacterium]|nr:hypothetical protein [Candidatus Saccharibacteria bacterium]
MKIFNALRKRITASAQPCQSASSLPRHSLRMLLALSILLALLAACGDESSSSVSPEPGDDSSSSVIPASSDDDLSSSSQKSSGEEKSSSSEKISKESSSSVSTVKNSSSSAGDNKSSSSIKKEDSSSSVVIASSSSSIKVDGSSASVKPESSSTVTSSATVASSSSVVEESSSSFDKAFKGSLWRTGAYKAFVDPRDNREYYYIQITGEDTAGKAATIKVMAENLNVGEKVYGFEDQEDDAKIERYCYDDDTTNCNKYGGLYQWAEMMQLPSRCNTESCADLIKPNHQGICPSGWRLLTYNDYYIVVHADNNEDGVKGTRAGRFGGSNDSGYSLMGAGYLFDHSFKEVETGTYWHYPEENPNDYAKMSKASWQSNASKSNPVSNMYKTQGFSVRCVMVE